MPSHPGQSFGNVNALSFLIKHLVVYEVTALEAKHFSTLSTSDSWKINGGNE
jgi:hypothetical protein